MCRYSDELLNQIWEKARVVEGYQPSKYRKDACGAWIARDKFGRRDSIFGWEVDHIFPESKLKDKDVPQDAIDDLRNLRPLNWHNNQSKGDDYPAYTSSCIAEENHNILKETQLIVRKYIYDQLLLLYKEYNL